jgi:G3E family GTPase
MEEPMRMERTVPVFILSGFLGSGKTTLLTRAIRYMKEQDRKPAVVMNELGEVNLDGVAVGIEVPMAEMLDGCICCTVRGDLGITIQQLIQDEQPDVIFIEATGVANPMEILDGVTEASLYMKVEMKGVVTVVDAAHLKEQLHKGTGKTYRLLEEQIRCASVLILNKADLVEETEMERLEEALRSWNSYARLLRTVRSEVDPAIWTELEGRAGNGGVSARHAEAEHEHAPGCGCGNGHTHQGDHAHGEGCTEVGHAGHAGYHSSHEHVMVYTHYLKGPVDSTAFEAMIGRLPESVYRAKGVLSFQDTRSRYLFQYAYRQADFMKIDPQGSIPDVVVFIGEQIPKAELEREMALLELEENDIR